MHGSGKAQARIFKSGNSLAVRIPGGIAKQLNLQEGTTMEIDVDDGGMSLRAVRHVPSLDQLIDGITPENVHEEQIPNLVGRERW
jgi:antitoxin MazE